MNWDSTFYSQERNVTGEMKMYFSSVVLSASHTGNVRKHCIIWHTGHAMQTDEGQGMVTGI